MQLEALDPPNRAYANIYGDDGRLKVFRSFMRIETRFPSVFLVRNDLERVMTQRHYQDLCCGVKMHLNPNWFNVVVGAVKCRALRVWSWFNVVFFVCACVCFAGIYLQNKFWWFMAYKLILPPGWAVAQPMRISVLCKMLKTECVWCAKEPFIHANLGINPGKIYHYRQQQMIQSSCPKGNCRIKTHRLIHN